MTRPREVPKRTHLTTHHRLAPSGTPRRHRPHPRCRRRRITTLDQLLVIDGDVDRAAPSCSFVGIERRTTKIGDVRYEVRLRGPDGRERSRTFRTRKAAETYERELLTQRDRGGWVDPRAGRITLADWVAEWSATLVNLRPSSRRIYLDNLRLHVLPELGAVQLNKLDKAMLRATLAKLAAGHF